MDLGQSPVIRAPRRIPIAVCDRVEEEQMKENGEKWYYCQNNRANPMSIVNGRCAYKKNKQVRVCIDPRVLNRAVKRCHYPLSTFEEVATRLPKAKVFSVFDAKSGFWLVKLSENSCKLTSLNTPFERYYWKRMP